MPAVQITWPMRESARRIGETMLAMRKGKATADEYRAAMRASREQHGDLHEVVKTLALSGATGGRG